LTRANLCHIINHVSTELNRAMELAAKRIYAGIPEEDRERIWSEASLEESAAMRLILK
jgi:hypothetical protein